MVSSSVTRISASSTVRGAIPWEPPVFCEKYLLLYSKYELSRQNEMSVSNTVGEILDGKSDGWSWSLDLMMRCACFMLHDVYSDLMSNEQKYECDEVSVMLRAICIMLLLSFSLKLLLRVNKVLLIVAVLQS